MHPRAFPSCEFCGAAGAGALLCDGQLSPGKSCDRRMCRKCAGKPVSVIHMQSQKKGGGRACAWDSRDLCPNCRKAGRSAW
jgi:hypothetical protein